MSFIRKFKSFQNWFKLRNLVILFITLFVLFSVRFFLVNYFYLDISIFIDFCVLGLLVSFFRALVTDFVDIVILSYFKPLVCEGIDDVVEKCGEDKLKGGTSRTAGFVVDNKSKLIYKLLQDSNILSFLAMRIL